MPRVNPTFDITPKGAFNIKPEEAFDATPKEALDTTPKDAFGIAPKEPFDATTKNKFDTVPTTTASNIIRDRSHEIFSIYQQKWLIITRINELGKAPSGSPS